MWILKTLNEEPERTFRLASSAVRTVGRATGADFILDAALVSRVHCRLSATEDGGLEIQDLESTNGTYVNGVKVDSARLADGDTLRLGRVELQLSRESA